MSKKYFLTLLVFIISIIIVVLAIKKHTKKNIMINSPIEFVYVDMKLMDSLILKYSGNMNKINHHLKTDGNYFSVNTNIYTDAFLNNPKICLTTTYLLLEESDDTKFMNEQNDKEFRNLDKEYLALFLKEFKKTKFLKSSEKDINEFEVFIDSIDKGKIFALLVYNKKEGWFDYNKSLNEKNKYNKSIQEMLKE